MEGKDWDLDAVDAVLSGAPRPERGSDAGRGAARDREPRAARSRAGRGRRCGDACRGALVRSARESAAARSRDAAALLEGALEYHAAHGDGDCPVCGRKNALDNAWSKKQKDAAARLRDAAREAEAVHLRADAARRQWEGLVPLQPEAFTRAAEVGLELGPLVEALASWVLAGSITDLGALADHVEKASGPLREAIVRLRESARAELGRKEDAWRPAVVEVAAWLKAARGAVRGAQDLKRLKAAEAWFKKAAAGIRDERFAPIAEKATRIWEHLRQQSNVELGTIQLTGEGTRRRVALDVTVDGVEGAALGVMSQGELHSLALSLFLPRATLAESPFRFIVIDDPVQSMDPARVDGLARVLESAPRTARWSCSPTTTGCPRPCAGSTSPPRSSRSRGATRRSWSCAGHSIPSGATWRTRSPSRARPTCRPRRPRAWCRGCAGSASRPRAWRWCDDAGSAAASPTLRWSGPSAMPSG